jgi:hypothetical protein
MRRTSKGAEKVGRRGEDMRTRSEAIEHLRQRGLDAKEGWGAMAETIWIGTGRRVEPSRTSRCGDQTCLPCRLRCSPPSARTAPMATD